MKRFPIIALAALLVAPVQAQSVKGIQWVLLSNANPSDATSFANVFSDGKGGYTRGPKEIEIAFDPYQYTPKIDRFANAQALIYTLSKDKILVFKVYLAFQNEQAAATIYKNASDLNGTFLKANINNPHVRFVISPILEDKLTNDAWNTVTSNVALRIDHRDRMMLCRNGLSSHEIYSAYGFGDVINEFHGSFDDPAFSDFYDDYSNDGLWVYNPAQNEDSHSLDDYSPAKVGLKYTIKAFTKAADTSGDIVSLWRPAMNLYRKYTRADGLFAYTQNGRAFNNSVAAFDPAEIATLKLFFGIK